MAMKGVQLLGILYFYLYCPMGIQSQVWKDIYQFTPAQTLNKLKFYNDQIGYTAGSLYNGSFENIHMTRDGGKTWKHANSGYTSMRFMDIYIQDEMTIFMSGNEGIIIRSTDGGNSWKTMNSNTTAQLWGIHFLDDQLGFAVGSSGTIIRTDNGGQDWTSVVSGTQNLFYDVFFTTQGVGFASGSNILLKSTDRGSSWTKVSGFPFEAPADWIRSIQMVNESIGYACADIGRIYKTTDGGDHWFRQTSGTQEALFSVDFVDEWNGMICGFNGTILHTTDGGQNWKLLQNPIGKEIFYAVDMITKDLGYICTHTGHILKLDMMTSTYTYDLQNVTIYPNPCSDYVILNSPVINFKQTSLQLCALDGKCTPLGPGTNTLDGYKMELPQGNEGFYFLKIQHKEEILKSSLIIRSK
jgi:photosystem II stability/assembly factor-like uncharacterized protein